jgi:DNA-binding protein Alba
MKYVGAILAFTKDMKQGSEIHLLARGRAISNAVDVAEVYRARANVHAKVKSINIGSEPAVRVDPKTKVERSITVSTIDICLTI